MDPGGPLVVGRTHTSPSVSRCRRMPRRNASAIEAEHHRGDPDRDERRGDRPGIRQEFAEACGGEDAVASERVEEVDRQGPAEHRPARGVEQPRIGRVEEASSEEPQRQGPEERDHHEPCDRAHDDRRAERHRGDHVDARGHHVAFCHAHRRHRQAVCRCEVGRHAGERHRDRDPFACERLEPPHHRGDHDDRRDHAGDHEGRDDVVALLGRRLGHQTSPSVSRCRRAPIANAPATSASAKPQPTGARSSSMMKVPKTSTTWGEVAARSSTRSARPNAPST